MPPQTKTGYKIRDSVYDLTGVDYYIEIMTEDGDDFEITQVGWWVGDRLPPEYQLVWNQTPKTRGAVLAFLALIKESM